MTEPTKSARIRRIGYSAPPTGTPIVPTFYDDDMDGLYNTDVIDPVLAQGTTPILGYTAGVRNDFTAPNTTIVATMNVTGSSASFSFTSSEPYSTFMARMDGAEFAAAVSPKLYTGLVTGGHLFEVYAVDVHGNADLSYSTGSWIITGSI